MTVNPDDIELRPATQEDYEFAKQVYHAGNRPLVEKIFSWDEAVQDENFAKRFVAEQGRILVYQKTPIGWIQVQDEPETYNLSQLYILPNFQNQGIGSSILKTFLAEASQKNKPATLRTLKANPARPLYERHGFVVVKEDDYMVYLRHELPGAK